MVKQFLFVFLCFVVLSHAQDQSGFISIDCGLADNSSYIDTKTGIYYVSDAEYTQTAGNGASKTISPVYQTVGLDKQFLNVRSFPVGTKNCYTITHPRLEGRSRYFLRARFMYGNYDNKVRLPKFDLHVGVNFWATIEFSEVDTILDKEILYAPRNSSEYTYVCLVNTENGTPFISALEIRLMDDGIYEAGESETLKLVIRLDLRSNEKSAAIIRYEEDVFDRRWIPSLSRVDLIGLNTSTNDTYKNVYNLPSSIMTTAITPKNPSDPFVFSWKPSDPTAGYYFFMHFVDFQSNLTRQFNIFINDKLWYANFTPLYMDTVTMRSTKAETPASAVNFSLIRTTNSSLPPMLNAFELFTVADFSHQLTNQEDVSAILEVKTSYGLKWDWQGDPCLPTAWESIGCFNITIVDNPRILSLNLSQNELTGKISPSIFKLKLLKQLDLSNNSLTGEVPVFLTKMESLDVLILSGNNLSGIVPAALVERSKSGLLELRVDGNPNLCMSDSCETKDSNMPPPSPPPPPASSQTASKINDRLVPIVAAVASLVGLIL